MTSLSQTALEFARECLGWHNCDKGASREWIVKDQESFDYTDLNAVMAAVHYWCKANHCQWAIFGNDRHEKFEYLAIILPFDDFWEARCDTAPSQQHALLAACVEAARKLKDSPAA